jgi:hypothetical protein
VKKKELEQKVEKLKELLIVRNNQLDLIEFGKMKMALG